jgi:hypothetical protein
VNVSASAASPAARAPGSAPFAALLLIGVVATAAAAVYGNGSLVIAIAPVLAVAGVAAIWLAPLRYSLFTLAALSLMVDARGDGPWNSPLGALGDLLEINLNKSFPIDALALPGMAVLLICLVVIHAHRSLTGSRIDGVARGLTAKPLFGALAVSFLAVLLVCAWGVLSGGDAQMAKIQVQSFVLVLLVAYLSAISLRGIHDYRTLGKIVLAAACVKGVIALGVHWLLPPPFEVSNGKLAYATAHGDSILFAAGAVLLLVQFMEQPSRRTGLLCLTLMPILVAGMWANNRRVVWVELVAALLAFWLISRRSPAKRFLIRGLLIALPLLVGYVAVGWSSQSALFAPIKTFRSVGDGTVDASTMYRELENFNLIQTLKADPLTGAGFGHPFLEVVTLPNISFFKEYRYMPHNSILGLWAFCGPFGFTGLALALMVGVYFAALSYNQARHPDERIAAFMAIGVVVIYLAHCWGDIGFTERRSIFLVGPALAIGAQLATSTGAWRVRALKRRS